MEQTSTPAAPRRSWVSGPLGVLAYLVGIAAVVALIVFLYPSEAPTQEAGATTTTTVPEVQVTAAPGEEPVADAAAVILPSVVYIQTPSGVGSGVIYDDGYVVTAAHVVGEHEQVQLRLSDGRLVTGTVVGSAPEVDIAVIRADTSGLPAAKFNTDKPRVGQMAIAVGSPWGLASTVTQGIVSAVDQTNCGVRGLTCVAMVQTDAAINPGNSGGALINRQGEVIGINVSIFTLSGANDGVGFAVPASIAVRYADAIIAGETIPTAFLGVTIEDSTDDRAGARIVEIAAGTAAEEAGLQVGDVVVSLDGVPIFTRGDLQAQVRAHQPGETVTLRILRDGQEIEVQVTLGVRNEEVS